MTAVVTGALAIAKDADGKQRYHYRGSVLHGVPAPEVDRLVEAGLVEHRQVLIPDAVVDSLDSLDSLDVIDDAELVDGEVTSLTELKRPAQVAPKSAWVDYAVAQGHPLVDAEALTKAELIELLGS